MLGTPCTSWSLARRGPPSSPWGPLRSALHVLGLPGLPPQGQARVECGNRTMRHTAAAVRMAIRHGVPAMLENPNTSRLFKAPDISRLSRSASFCRRVLDQCQYNTPWRKRTTLWGWNTGHEPAGLDVRCQGRQSRCSRTARLHVILKGNGPHGKLWTSIAQAYPKPLADKIADLLVTSFENIRIGAGLLRV